MTFEQPSLSDNPLLRGLFGVFQAGAAEHQSTADIWTSLRTAVGGWQAQAQGLPQPYDPVALEESGREILRAQGINAASVSTFRGIAGQWLGSRERLAGLESSEQITGREIFTPPWSTTASDVVPSRYRIRTQWQIEPTDGEAFTRWKADEVTGPITNLDAALGDAEPTADTQSGRMITSGGAPPTLLDFEIEQI